MSAPASPETGRLVMPSDAEVEALAGEMGDNLTRRLLGGLAVGVLNPLGEGYLVQRTPSMNDPDYPPVTLKTWGVANVTPLMTFKERGIPDMTGQDRWNSALKEWPRTSVSGKETPDVVIVDNFKGRVSQRTSPVVGAILRDRIPVVIWRDWSVEPPTGTLAALPILHREPQKLAATMLAMILTAHEQPK